MLQKCKRDKDIKEELEKLPRGLDKTYRRIVDQMGQLDDRLQTLVQRTLTWVFYTRRPLSITELVEATAIDQSCLTRQDLDSNKYHKTDIFQACANLITRESSVVRPIHYSVREYFTKTLDDKDSKVFRSLTNRNLAHAYLADCCMQYLQLDTLASRPCRQASELHDRTMANPLAAYAAYYFDYYILQLDAMPPDLKYSLNQLLLRNEASLASLLQLRNLRNNSDWFYIDGNFTIPEKIAPEDIVFSTTLYNSTHLLSTNERWNNIQPPEHALHLAAKAGSLDAIKILIEAGKLVTQEDTHGLTPLYYASEGGHIVVCRLLIEHGGDVNAQGGYFGNALQAASSEGHQTVIDILLAKGADVNAQGGYYGNALQAASSRGHQTVVNILLANGANVNIQGGHYGSALQVASLEGHEAIVNILVANGADVNANGSSLYGSALQVASLEGYEAIVNILVANGVDINAQIGGIYDNALQAASSRGHEAIVNVLLANGADVNIQGGHYGNALQVASLRGHQAVVNILLANGADVNAQSDLYDNALQAALVRGHQAIVDVLLAKGATFNA
jgi:ankyrin repeat protein